MAVIVNIKSTLQDKCDKLKPHGQTVSTMYIADADDFEGPRKRRRLDMKSSYSKTSETTTSALVSALYEALGNQNVKDLDGLSAVAS